MQIVVSLVVASQVYRPWTRHGSPAGPGLSIAPRHTSPKTAQSSVQLAPASSTLNEHDISSESHRKYMGAVPKMSSQLAGIEPSLALGPVDSTLVVPTSGPVEPPVEPASAPSDELERESVVTPPEAEEVAMPVEPGGSAVVEPELLDVVSVPSAD